MVESFKVHLCGINKLVLMGLVVFDHSMRSRAWIITSMRRNRSSISCSRNRHTLPTSTLKMVSYPRIDESDLQSLEKNNYVVLDGFLSKEMEESLRDDVLKLRQASKFSVAKIGQDTTNKLNMDIRVAETCFLGPEKLSELPNSSRIVLYDLLDGVRNDLVTFFGRPLDGKLTELLYAYYPQGGFYRRHRDAIPGSASTLREYSLLLYLNKEWGEADGGFLRLHKDSGGDALPPGEAPCYEDVAPFGGRLVLFKSDAVPHEVLDTNSERVAIVGWYNRPVSVGDIAELSQGIDPKRLVLLALSAALVAFGFTLLPS